MSTGRTGWRENKGGRMADENEQAESSSVSAGFLYEQMMLLVREAQAQTGEGNYAYLDGLERKIKLLCDAAVDLPREEGRRFAANLENLVGEIDKLKLALEGQKNDVKRQLENLHTQRRAHVAYKNNEPQGDN